VSFLDWMNMNMFVDIAFFVFAVATVWKFTKVQNRIHILERDLKLTMRNPAAAKRLLKERQ
jgi:hypothetical protein